MSKIVGFDSQASKIQEAQLHSGSLKVHNDSLSNIETTLNTHSGYIDEIETHMSNVNTNAISIGTKIDQHKADNVSKLQDILTKNSEIKTLLNDGSQKTLLVGANDINGGTPHRHLTVEGNGRLLTIPHMPTTNARLLALTDGTQKGILLANDGDDGAGTNRTVKCDSVGVLSVADFRSKSHSFENGISFADNATTNSTGFPVKKDNIGVIWTLTGNLLQSPEIQVSVDNTNYYTLLGGLDLSSQFNLNLSGNYEFVGTVDCPFPYIRVSATQSGAGHTISSNVIFSNT